MKIARSLCVTTSLLGLFAFTVAADIGAELGYRADTVVLPLLDSECEDSLHVHHDDTFENGYCWGYGGIVPPYYGAFAEGFSMGAGFVECGAFWFTQAGNYWPCPMDLYVWEGGAASPPGIVLFMSGGHLPENVPPWPTIGQNDFPIGLGVSGEFTVGYWADHSSAICPYYIAADLNGPGGHPWVNIAPGIGYPTGWQDPSMIWGPTQSLGIGVYFQPPPTEVTSETWGRLKSLFAR